MTDPIFYLLHSIQNAHQLSFLQVCQALSVNAMTQVVLVVFLPQVYYLKYLVLVKVEGVLLTIITVLDFYLNSLYY